MLLLHRFALRKFHMTDSQNTCDQIMKGGRSKHARSNCILCIPFILSGSPSESCLHTYVRNNNLENRIAGYSYRLQLIFIYTIQEHSAQMTSVE